ncbi:hypothetical protein AVEN_102963-1 [Araneus ventricosus]|uniref:Uncharacterized protein n=1 Tax=Araneus ventricosus TaxID=182803 RepID=A0A4Y2BA33_ARAVE|nr:hypothetical protein AVEN_102963-1 [Araneus ventricosus]
MTDVNRCAENWNGVECYQTICALWTDREVRQDLWCSLDRDICQERPNETRENRAVLQLRVYELLHDQRSLGESERGTLQCQHVQTEERKVFRALDHAGLGAKEVQPDESGGQSQDDHSRSGHDSESPVRRRQPSTRSDLQLRNPRSLEGGGGLITAGESSKSSDMLYSKASSTDKEDELISESASDSRDCRSIFSNGGRTAIGKSSMSTEVGVVVGKGFNVD